MKRRPLYLLALGFLVTLTLAGCHKVCTCVGYDYTEHEFTPEEVDAHGSGNCSYMRDFPTYDRYSYCHW